MDRGIVVRTLVLGMIGLVALAGCYGEPQSWRDNPGAVKRYYAEQFQDQPFDEGAVSILTEEHGELHTYKLRPCRNGTRICGARTGTFEKTPDYTIVRGAYGYRTFYLSPGGDGYLVRNGRTTPLAWNEE